MATTRKTQKKTKGSSAPGGQSMGRGAVRDLVEEVLRGALRTQARELEKHLNDIDTRLTALEKR
tara:strand:+ start:936 stop:1127 length:192 start_codon:yes stop_codon:yes gene_type:complete